MRDKDRVLVLILTWSECKSVKGNQCIFPFQYKGVTYETCTKANSDNGAGRIVGSDLSSN